MDKVKFLNLLSICTKAGRISAGFEQAKESVLNGKAELVIVASDISAKTEKEIRFFAEKKNVAVMRADITVSEIHGGTGRKAGVAAICDRGFADKLSGIISE